MKEFKGVWIPKEILVDKNLNDKEKITYVFDKLKVDQKITIL